ncbi:MAG: alpha/beta fold hydrolase [Chloroflexi bacterium]|nr:alpha/beta fold hydrolase [Chloroflexota bacterium]
MKGRIRWTGFAAAITATPFALAWRFAHVYRGRAGYPRPMPPTSDPSAFGLSFESRLVRTADGLDLPAWWMPAAAKGGAPAVVLVHGWESARHRTLPNARFLHALGYHVLAIDVRGHGANPAETLPVSAGEFGADALAAVEWALADPGVTNVAVLGHSLGAVGAILAAAAEPRVAAVIVAAAPVDPYRLTRQTFRLAHLPIPDVVAYPLAWLTTRVYLEPRGRTAREVSATDALRRYAGPVLVIHGTDDRVVPFAHMARLVAAGRATRTGDARGPAVESLAIPEGRHSWLYEFPAYRAAIGRFLAVAFGGPLSPDDAAATAAGVDVRRPVEPDHGFSALAKVESTPGGSGDPGARGLVEDGLAIGAIGT